MWKDYRPGVPAGSTNRKQGVNFFSGMNERVGLQENGSVWLGHCSTSRQPSFCTQRSVAFKIISWLPCWSLGSRRTKF